MDGQIKKSITSDSEVNKPKREIAYVIKDPLFDEFNVVKSANAWWMDKGKVDKLIDAFKSGHIIKTAIIYTGISQDQWRYFNETHPDFSRVKEACEEVQTFKAMNTVNINLDDPTMARWFMDRRHPKFASKVRTDTDAPLQPTISNSIDVGNIININAGEISAALRDIARQVFGANEEDSRAISDEVMEGLSQNEEKV